MQDRKRYKEHARQHLHLLQLLEKQRNEDAAAAMRSHLESTLRNITKTGPYFHDGSVKTLDEAVSMMGKHQLGIELSKEEVASIITWLGSLTGEIPMDYIAKPRLPDSNAATPRPDTTVTASIAR